MSLIHGKARIALLSCALCAAASVPLACSTPTRFTSEWKDPSSANAHLSKVVVIALDLTPSQRRTLEDRMSAELIAKGTKASPSYSVLGDPLPDRETAKAFLQKTGYDGALVVRLHNVKQSEQYVNGPETTVWGSPYWGYSTQPGYYVPQQTVTFESSLYDLRDGRRIWTATTDTDNPSSHDDFAKSLSGEVIPRLEELGLVAGR